MPVQLHLRKAIPAVTVSLVTFSCVLLLPLFSPAQTKYLAGNYWVENYGKKEGLPEHIVVDISQDRKGYIWLTTPYSLVRFNGYEFKSFSPIDQFPGLKINLSSGLLEDSRGNFWMGSIETGAFCFNPQTQKFSRYYRGDHAGAISGDRIMAIEEDGHHNIWIGTMTGLNALFYQGDSIKVKQYTRQLTGSLLDHFDRIIDHEKALVSLIRVGNLENRQQFIEIKDTARFCVISMGEGEPFNNTMVDYGWIEDDRGKLVWKQAADSGFNAGGVYKNILNLEIVRLLPGRYKVAYKTDEAHAWNSWTAAPPDHPELWGIQLFRLPPALADTIEELIKNGLYGNPLSGDIVISMLVDSGNTMWNLTNLGVEKLLLPSDAKGKLIKVKIPVLPHLDFQSNIIKTGPGQFLITGSKFDSTRKANETAWTFFDDVKQKSRSIVLSDSSNKNLSQSFYHNLVRDPRGIFWYGTFNNDGNGLYTAEEGKEAQTFKRLDLSPPGSHESGRPSFEQIWSVFEDRSGYVWVGSREFGLYKIRWKPTPIRFVPVFPPGKLELNSSRIAADDHGNLLLDKNGQNLFLYHAQNGQMSNLFATPKDSVKNIFYNPLEKVFIIAGKRQTRAYDPVSSGLKPITIRVPDSLVLLAVDAYGNFWAFHSRPRGEVSPHKNFFVYDGSKFRTVPFDSSGDYQGFFRTIYFSRNGNIWVAPGFEGLHEYKWDSIAKRAVLVRKFLPGQYDIFSICEDQEGFMWVGTYDNGVIRVDPLNGKCTYWTKKEGMSSNFIAKVMLSGTTIVALTDLGTALINTTTGAVSLHKEVDESISQYNYNDYIEHGYHQTSLVTPSGEIAIVTKQGLCLFKPADLSVDSSRPILHITDLNVGKQAIAFNESGQDALTLKHDQNDMEISYVGLHYDRPSLDQYAYFLQGADRRWVSAGTQRVARYSHLLPGHYEFYLKSANASGVWTEPQKLLVFDIRPPWWETWWAYTLYAVLIVAIVWSIIRYRSLYLKKENLLLEEKVNLRTSQLKQSIEDLKAAQTQLIQSEKMASLGELTAGIAHEIRNPLNFVNNFAEVNKELLAELKTEIENGSLPLAGNLTSTLIENEDKIILHGKRADAIVKGMLLHSRNDAGEKLLADINALLEECTKLTYHNWRAKDKSFELKSRSDMDPSIGKFLFVPQDITRVVLNVLNNAFYAVSEKKKEHSQGYNPVISVSSKKLDNWVYVMIKDNGNGIPDRIKDKIFQPFFTTKPTGQGTGLGLSLSYDIIKSHGGNILVESHDGVGSEFRIQLPYLTA